MQRLVYFAAPVFTQAERVWNKNLAAAILRKCKTINLILPQEESKKATDNEKGMNFQKLFKLCLSGIDRCDIVLAILDGADSDSGTCFECGYASARNKAIIGVRTDLRTTGEHKSLNAMLSQSCTSLISGNYINNCDHDIEKLADEIIEEINQIERS